MTTRTDIITELEAVAPLLAHAPTGSLFDLPPDYFQSFPDYISARLGQAQKSNLVPEGYFENLPAFLLSTIKASEVAEELSVVAPSLQSITRIQVYHLPSQYFEIFAAAILSKIDKEISESELSGIAPLLFDIPRAPVQWLPPAYFENFEMSLAQLQSNNSNDLKLELQELAPVLNRISKAPVQSVPAGYFDTVQIITPGKVAEQKPSILRKLKGMSWVKYASAACIAAVLSFTAYNLFTNKQVAPIPGINILAELSKVEDSTIEKYLQTEIPASESGIAAAVAPVKEEEIRTILLEFSEEELQQYLVQQGESPTVN